MTNKICDGCETVAHCLKNGCVPKMTKQTQVRSTEEAPARSALKLALEALEWAEFLADNCEATCQDAKHSVDTAITAIREALALVNFVDQEESSGTEQPAQPQQEPVGEAYLCDKCQTPFDGAYYCPECGHNTATKESVYTSPPTLSLAQRQSRSDVKPLTDDEIWREYRFLWPFHPDEERKLASDILLFAKAIEAKLWGKDNA